MLEAFFQLSAVPANQLIGYYDFKLVCLSYIIAVLTSYTTLDIIGNLRAVEASKTRLWILIGAITMGVGLWSMHFVGMLSFYIPGMAMSYDSFWTVLSLIIAIIGSGFAVGVLAHKKIKTTHLLLGGMILATAIGAMHYGGMEAMRQHINIHYVPSLFLLSGLIAIIASEVALWLALKSSSAPFHKRFKLNLISAVIMGAGICGTHYMGMAAAIFTPKIPTPIHIHALDQGLLSITVAALTSILLMFSFFISRRSAIYQKMRDNIEHEKHSLQVVLGDKLQFALDTARLGSWDFNLATNTAQRTLMHDQILGYPELLPKWTPEMFYELVHPDDREKVKESVKNAIKNNTILEGKFRIYRANDQSLRWLWARGRCAMIDKTPHLVGLIQDITDRMIASEKLRLSEERLRLLLNNTQEYAIYMITADGIISYWNQAAEKILGYREAEIIGKNVSILFSPQDKAQHYPDYMRKIARETGHYEERNWRFRKDGTKFYATIVYTRLNDNSNNIIGYCIIMRDLTEQLITDNKLRQISELRRSNEDLEQFAYVASHDLKAPLRAIKNLSTWIGQDKATVLSQTSKDYLQLLMARTTRMEKLIEGILQYSRAGLVDKEITKVSLTDLLNEVISEVNPPKTFVINFPNNLPSLLTSKVQLSQVLSNLIDNGVKYHDRVDGHIEIGLKDLEDFYEFSVTDDGPGIEEEYHERIFQLFQTLQSQDTIPSTGLGLAIVKKIIEAQGGTITVASSKGKGSTFSFTWPKQPVHDNVNQSNELEQMV